MNRFQELKNSIECGENRLDKFYTYTVIKLPSLKPTQDDDSWRSIPWVSSEIPQETGRFRSELAGKSYESGAWIRRPYPTADFKRFRSFLVGSEQNRINPMNGSGHWNTASAKSPEYYGTARFRAGVFDLGCFRFSYKSILEHLTEGVHL